jgi:RNA polymerase sigma-70 factor (ECF subfamily)
VAEVLQDEAVLAVVEGGLSRDQLYEQVAQDFRDALARLARGYESDPDKCRDLLQEIHLALWRSFDAFDGRCSLRTWVYRVAHNVAISQVTRRRAATPPLISLEDFETLSTAGRFDDREKTLDRQRAMDRLFALIQKLKPVDRQTTLLYLEGLAASRVIAVLIQEIKVRLESTCL